MDNFREFARKLPILPSLYAVYRKLKSTEQIFTRIFETNAWAGKDSVSGSGSDTYQTEIIVKELAVLFVDYRISSVLDIPCGDFHWMKNVDLGGVDYKGADIVRDLIQQNTRRYGRDSIQFKRLDLIGDMLPTADLILCRDCLVHFSFADVFRALNNVCSSGARYFLTTTFTERLDNDDIATGQWRVLNLQAPPFMLAKPVRLINEGCSEGNGAYKDKSLGLWEIADIREILATRTGGHAITRR